MALALENLESYVSYASFKIRCIKVIGENQEIIETFLQQKEADDFLLKLNVLWDTSCKAREVICHEHGKWRPDIEFQRSQLGFQQ